MCQQTSECQMQKKRLLAVVHATEERLIAPQYMIQNVCPSIIFLHQT